MGPDRVLQFKDVTQAELRGKGIAGQNCTFHECCEDL